METREKRGSIMKKKFIFIFLILFWSSSGRVFAQDSVKDAVIISDYFSFPPGEETEDFTNLDTMSIEEVLLIKKNSVFNSAYNADKELILSKSRIDRDFNYGILWQDGTLVPLPRESVPQTVAVKRGEGEFILVWFRFEKADGSFSYHQVFFPEKDMSGRYMTIKPMMRKIGY